MTSTKICIVIPILCFAVCISSAQTTNKYTFTIAKEPKRNHGRLVHKRDSIHITFMYGYKNDIVSFHTKQKVFMSDTLLTDELYGIAGYMKIAKKDLKGDVLIYFNNDYIGKLILQKKFSSVHLEYNRTKNSFEWRYLRYRFVFL